VFQAILGDYPELPEPHNNLAVLYAQKGEYELARGELEAAISAAPDYAVAYENLGDVYARLAALNYEKALARDARNRTASAKLKLARDVLAPPAAPVAAVAPPVSAPAGMPASTAPPATSVPPATAAPAPTPPAAAN
jgi:tetratricopeptide (TPR) repeat protein